MKLNRSRFAWLMLVALLPVLLPGVALAAKPPGELRYDFLDLGVTFGEVDTAGDDVDFSGVGIAGSWGFHDNFALFASLGAGEIEAFSDIDTTELSVGINPHFAITEKVDIVIPVALEWADFDGAGFSDDDMGYSIGVGIRALPSPALEFGAGVRYLDIFNDSATSFAANVRWHITHLFSVGLGGDFGDDVSALLLDARFSF